jgi:3-oxoacyl-[acyl-carrier-protein] synthase-3
MQMDGQAVFKFAVKSVPEVINEALELNHVSSGEISYYILHQANRRIIEAVARRLGEPMEKFPVNLQEYGNTSSASIPILLDEMNREGKLRKGQKLVLAGFGAGLTWGASIIEWHRCRTNEIK